MNCIDKALEGKRIKLRDWKEKDFKCFKHWHSDHYRWMDYDAPYYSKPTLEEVDTYLIDVHDGIIKNDWPSIRQRLIIADQELDKLIGTVSWYWQSKETLWKSIGIVIYDHHYWGMGIGEESLRLWIDYLFFVSPDLVRLDLRTWSGNIGMIKLAEKLGFSVEARFRNARKVDGQFYDGIAMGILREEWIV